MEVCTYIPVPVCTHPRSNMVGSDATAHNFHINFFHCIQFSMNSAQVYWHCSDKYNEFQTTKLEYKRRVKIEKKQKRKKKSVRIRAAKFDENKLHTYFELVIFRKTRYIRN